MKYSLLLMQVWLCEMYSNGVNSIIVYFLIVMHAMQCLQPVISAFARLKKINNASYFFTVDDFRVVSSDILISSAAGLDVAVTISDDGIAGEPMENLTITSQPPLVSGSSDARFLFRDSVVNIIDSDGK